MSIGTTKISGVKVLRNEISTLCLLENHVIKTTSQPLHPQVFGGSRERAVSLPHDKEDLIVGR